jgi:hypothetical protein
MFQFSRLPSRFLCIQNRITRHYSDRISPFGYPRINTSVQLPWAFRRFRVLHRHLVPRHSSYTLLSLIFTRSFIECSMYASLNHYAIFKELCRRPPVCLVQRQEEMIPAANLSVKVPLSFFAKCFEPRALTHRRFVCIQLGATKVNSAQHPAPYAQCLAPSAASQCITASPSSNWI